MRCVLSAAHGVSVQNRTLAGAGSMQATLTRKAVEEWWKDLWKLEHHPESLWQPEVMDGRQLADTVRKL